MLKYDDATTLALLYHLNSEPWLNVEAYAASTTADAAFRTGPAPGRRLQVLPRPGDAGVIGHAIRGRRSCRAFDPRPMSLELLATLLSHGYGIAEKSIAVAGQSMLARPVPSAGGLYPLSLFAMLRRVEGMEDGVYRYHPLGHGLEAIAPLPSKEEAGELLLAQPFVTEASAVVFISAALELTLGKYGARGYRYLLLEAGHVAQNLCLLAVANGMTSLCIGGFHEDTPPGGARDRLRYCGHLELRASGAASVIAIPGARCRRLATAAVGTFLDEELVLPMRTDPIFDGQNKGVGGSSR